MNDCTTWRYDNHLVLRPCSRLSVWEHILRIAVPVLRRLRLGHPVDCLHESLALAKGRRFEHRKGVTATDLTVSA